MKQENAKLVIRAVVPVRDVLHGVRVAQAIKRLYSGVSEVVAAPDWKTVVNATDIHKIEIAEQQD